MDRETEPADGKEFWRVPAWSRKADRDNNEAAQGKAGRLKLEGRRSLPANWARKIMILHPLAGTVSRHDPGLPSARLFHGYRKASPALMAVNDEGKKRNPGFACSIGHRFSL